MRAKAVDFVRNPVTEVAVLPLDEGLTAEEKAAMSEASGIFGKALLGAPAPVKYADGTAHQQRQQELQQWYVVRNADGSTYLVKREIPGRDA